MIKVFAHRGASGTYPENTKSAILAAVDQAVDGIEIDVQSCLDDYMIFMTPGLIAQPQVAVK